MFGDASAGCEKGESYLTGAPLNIVHPNKNI